MATRRALREIRKTASRHLSQARSYAQLARDLTLIQGMAERALSEAAWEEIGKMKCGEIREESEEEEEIPTEESWVKERLRDPKFRRRFWWENFKGSLRFWLWTWPTDGLVWEFDLEDGPRLRHARSGRWLDLDDPRHWEDA